MTTNIVLLICLFPYCCVTAYILYDRYKKHTKKQQPVQTEQKQSEPKTEPQPDQLKAIEEYNKEQLSFLDSVSGGILRWHNLDTEANKPKDGNTRVK